MNKNTSKIKEYVEKNRDWLEELALSGEIIPRAMALAILKVAGEPEGIDRDAPGPH